MKQQEESQLTGEVKILKTTPVIPSLSRDLNKAAQILKEGGVIIFPTDTVYGIGCRYDNQKAIDLIYEIKGTAKSQPFPILVSSPKQVENLAHINPKAKELMKKYWPGGLTIILPTRHPELVSGSNQKIGVRLPGSQATRALIEQTGVPIIGTSANFHGKQTPRSYEELDPEFIKLADFVLKGECKERVESTVVDATVDPIKVVRQGAIKI